MRHLTLPVLGLGLTASAQDAQPAAPATTQPARSSPVVIGEGRHRYEWIPGWLQLPAGRAELGNTHGCILTDLKGDVYFNTDTEDAVMVYSPDGRMLRSFGKDMKGFIHGMCLVQEKEGEFLYINNHMRHEWRKYKTDGTEVYRVDWPEKSGVYKKPEDFHPTCIAVVPDQFVFVADGYGQHWIHKYDTKGNYIATFGGLGDAQGKVNCPHGIAIDWRTTPPTLICADRANHRLQIFDLDGKSLRIVRENKFRLPCHMFIDKQSGDMLVPDLLGRVTVLDKDFNVLTNLGDNPDVKKRGNNGVDVKDWEDGVFIAPHCAHWDKDGNLYVMDWNKHGRINKLRRLPATSEASGAKGDK